MDLPKNVCIRNRGGRFHDNKTEKVQSNTARQVCNLVNWVNLFEFFGSPFLNVKSKQYNTVQYAEKSTSCSDFHKFRGQTLKSTNKNNNNNKKALPKTASAKPRGQKWAKLMAPSSSFTLLDDISVQAGLCPKLQSDFQRIC